MVVGMDKLRRRTAVTLAAAGASLAFALPAAAGTGPSKIIQRPSLSSFTHSGVVPLDTTNILNLFNAPGLCVQTHGTGNPVTIVNNGQGCTQITFHYLGGIEWQLKSSSANCLTVKTSLANKVVPQSCSSGNQAQEWLPYNTDRETWAPVLNESWRLGVYNDVSGHPVYADGGVTWTGWVIRV